MKKPHQQLLLALGLSLAVQTATASSMLGAYVDGDGWQPAQISNFNAVTAKPLAVVNLFSGFSMNWNSHLSTQASNIVAQGAMPMITWMPVDSSRNTANLLPEIIGGQWDTYIDTWIQGLRLWRDSYPLDKRPTVMLRFAHEFNGSWYPWANDPDNLKAAWRHVHARFQAAGINNSVEWIWCANNVNVDNYNDITRYYPGDDVVDLTGLDGYNWGSNYSFSQWKGFDATFSVPYLKLIGSFPTKPVVIAEVASTEPLDVPDVSLGQDGTDADARESKELWVQDMYSRIRTDYPAIRAAVWFNTNKELDWALNGSSNTGLTAYNNAVVDPYYLGTFSPLKTTTTTTSGGKGGGKGGSTTDSGGGGKKPRLSSTISTEAAPTSRLTGIEQATTISHMPAAVGEKLLEMEAHGFRNLPSAALEQLRKARLHGL